MGIERNLKLINFLTFFAGAWFFVPILLPFCKDEIGVGYQDMMLSEALFSFASLVFDVPTGWISDVWRRKNAIALGAVLNLIGLVILMVASNLWHLIAAQMFMGVGVSFFNGTNTALLYDTLLSLGRVREYRRREGKRQAFSFYGIAAAGVVAGFLYTLDHFLPLFCSMIAFLLVFAAACLMHEPERHRPVGVKTPISDILKTFRYVLRGHETIGFVIFLAASIFSCTRAIMWTQQPYYMAMNIPPAYYGVLMAAGWGLGGLSSHGAHVLDGQINNFRVLALAWGAAILCSLVAGAFLGYGGIVCLLIGGGGIYGATSPRVNEIINQNVGPTRRATLLSTQTFASSVLFVPLSILVGRISDAQGIQTALFFLALWLCCAGTALFVWKRHHVLPAFKS